MCVLRHEALIAPLSCSSSSNKADNEQQQHQLIGREELYRSVEDLCVHKFGILLYSDVVQIMDDAAGEVVRRLSSSGNNDAHHRKMHHNTTNVEKRLGLDAIVDEFTGDVGYDASQLIIELNFKDGGCSRRYDPTAGLENNGSTARYSENRHALLRRMHLILRTSYSQEYLTFLRSIFLVLDRAYLYFAHVDLDKICGRGIGMESDTPPGGRVMERSSFSSGSSQSGIGSDCFARGSARVWGLWEVGVACLRKHMLRKPAATNMMSFAVMQEKSSLGNVVGERANNDVVILPVLTTMVLTTAYAILSEYDDLPLPSYSSAKDVILTDMSDIRLLIRNCVRTIIDLGVLPSLLEELIVVASVRFKREGQWWYAALLGGGRIGEMGMSGEALSTSSSNVRQRSMCSASDFLLHVENRLRQSGTITGYYLPGNAASTAALRQLAKLPCLNGAFPSSSTATEKVVVWSPANVTTRRMLPAIIETQLIALHLVPTSGGLLEQRHLYPILDGCNDDRGGEGVASGVVAASKGGRSLAGSNGKTYRNAKRLYGLCWRMTVSSQPAAQKSSPSNSSVINVSNPILSLSTGMPLDLLRVAFGEYGRLRGNEIVKQGFLSSKNWNNKFPSSSSASSYASNINKEMEKNIIPDLLAFKSHLYVLHAVAFHSDELFGNMVRSVLEDVLNGGFSNNNSNHGDNGDGGRRFAELLAKHVDARFKDAKAQATTSSSPAVPLQHMMPLLASANVTDANEAFQTEILALFRHVYSKDVFEAFYKRDLAKRLLTGRVVSTDMEKRFLSKLKAECGAGYTSKMEGMFKDMELSRGIMGSYAAFSSGLSTFSPSTSENEVDMDVRVLTTGYWPVYPKFPNIILPPELLVLRNKFESYYNDKYQGRRIAWQYSLGNCIVKAFFPKSSAHKELIVNVCQSLVLLCFTHEDAEDGFGLTLEDIMKRTGIEDKKELERVLQSLSMGRDGTRVLKKVDYNSSNVKPLITAACMPIMHPHKTKEQRVRRTVSPHDRFLFNTSFTSNQRRIRITNITMKETAEERTKTHAAVSKDRLYFIDAAVVRIMKARKVIDHRMLMGEVLAQLKFPAASADIKKRIESLIEREYMERVDGGISKYKYLA